MTNPAVAPASLAVMTQPSSKYAALPAIWQYRFDFYDRYGAPSSPSGRAALAQLTLAPRLTMKVNVWGFLFAALYFFVKGMWRKGLTLLAVNITIPLVLSAAEWPAALGQLGNLVTGVTAMLTANYAYYLHVVAHSRSWNPLEGLGRRIDV